MIEAFGPFLEPKFWIMLSFGIFVYVFVRKGIKPLLGGIDNHIAGIKTGLAKAEQLQTEAADLLKEYQEKHTSSMQRAEEIAAEAKAQAAQMHDTATKALQESLKRKEAQLDGRLKQLELNAQDELRRMVANLAVDTAKQALANQNDAAHQSNLLGKTVEQLKA